MNKTEANRLLAAVALGDNRTTDDTAVAYWAGLLHDIRLEDALEAVAIHRRENTAWLQPAHIVALVRQIRNRRIDVANITYEPIGEETARESLDRIGATFRAAGDGRLDPRRIGRTLEADRDAPTVPAEIEAAIKARKAIRSALNVACPFCQAAPRTACKVGSTAKDNTTFSHPSRIDAARTAGPEGTS